MKTVVMTPPSDFYGRRGIVGQAAGHLERLHARIRPLLGIRRMNRIGIYPGFSRVQFQIPANSSSPMRLAGFRQHFWKQRILSTKRSKRWNGELDSLAPEFLKEVLGKMEAYGDRVQFEQPNKSPRPNYQVISQSNRKMGFDDKHLLLRLNEDGNVGELLSPEYSLDAIRAAMNGAGKKPAARSTTAAARRPNTSGGVARGAPVTAAAAAADEVEREKYAYFKANREYLPEGIARYSQQISDLMRTGMAAENAFEAIVKQYF
jgi:hypothetical protein